MRMKLKRKPMRRWVPASMGGGALVARLLRRLHDEGKCMLCDERIVEADQIELWVPKTLT